jgi:hypothetical protein
MDIPVRRLRRAVAAGDHDAQKVRGVWRFLWRQAVYIALQRWMLAEIEYALGERRDGRSASVADSARRDSPAA